MTAKVVHEQSCFTDLLGQDLSNTVLRKYDLHQKNYSKPILKTTIIEKLAFGSPSRIVNSFLNQL